MADFIDREVITEYLMGRIKDYLEMDDRLATIPLKFAMAYIQHLPSAADVAPVVRCRDCRYYDPEDWGGITCKADGGMTDPDEDSFCSQGERRTDNGKAVDEG